MDTVSRKSLASEFGVYLEPVGDDTTNPFPPPLEHITYDHGDAVDIPWRKKDYRFICCECGFVHRLRFSVAGDKLRMRVWDDKRWTEEQEDG